MIVTFTANDRVDYMRQVLDSWSRAYGINEVDVHFRCEPGQPAMHDLCRSFDVPRTTTVTVNENRLGALANPWHAMDDGFLRGHTFVICAEDDSIVSPGVLDYFHWAADMYADSDDILCVCAFCAGSRWCGDNSAVYRAKTFKPTIWGTWASRWPELTETWDFDYSTGNGADAGWDCNIGLRVLAGRSCLFPATSRSQHIGRDNGTHMTPNLFDLHQSRCFYSSAPPPTDYTERT